MKARADRTTTPTGFIEMGTITFEGREFTNGGALVSDTHLICYPGRVTHGPGWGDPEVRGIVTSWNGEHLGTYRVTGHVTLGRNRQGSSTTLTCYRVRLDDGREYVGRGLGAGMILKCRRAATKKGTGQ